MEKTTRHQMAVFGRATRTIIVNCNIWADGNDALSLWAKEGKVRQPLRFIFQNEVFAQIYG